MLKYTNEIVWIFDPDKYSEISDFYQYRHLDYVSDALSEDETLQLAFGDDDDYIVSPDVVIGREPNLYNNNKGKTDTNTPKTNDFAARTPNIKRNNEDVPILHATVSCKWTMRSDRSQNARTEALNIIRNRKGMTPHIVVVTAEPKPTRISSIAMGTGDIDCTYHIALPELLETVNEVGSQDQKDALQLLLKADRLRDISDLIFDLAA